MEAVEAVERAPTSGLVGGDSCGVREDEASVSVGSDGMDSECEELRLEPVEAEDEFCCSCNWGSDKRDILIGGEVMAELEVSASKDWSVE